MFFSVDEIIRQAKEKNLLIPDSLRSPAVRDAVEKVNDVFSRCPLTPEERSVVVMIVAATQLREPA